ncbi:hypothetical protein AB0P37_08445 [Streptomyces antimycoticus]|uniref:hypothetical protein n=1 Tax=Streptomyces antimycoticus TaxID=68175 RepID=UPI003420637B
MSETFTTGETVTIGAANTRYRVEVGPYQGPGDMTFYVVSDPARTVFRTAYANAMERITPAFEVGGTVKILGETCTLLAGPFNNGVGSIWWAIRDSDGDELSSGQKDMTDYQPPAPAPETFTYNGVAYEVGATYEDAEGDLWTLEELPADERANEVWRMVGDSVRSIVSTVNLLGWFGPLTKVTD